MVSSKTGLKITVATVADRLNAGCKRGKRAMMTGNGQPDLDPPSDDEPAPPENSDPVVGATSRGIGPVAAAVCLALAGVVLFAVLNHHRVQGAGASLIKPAPPATSQPAAPPPLRLAAAPPQPTLISGAMVKPTPLVLKADPTPVIMAAPAPVVPDNTVQRLNAPAVVVDLAAGASGANRRAAATPGPPLITRGTIFSGMLQPAIASGGSGGVRAIVSRDVFGVDGRTVLIPRGSRLSGQSGRAATPGSRRSVIVWALLTRPDGVALQLDTPTTDDSSPAVTTSLSPGSGQADPASAIDIVVGRDLDFSGVGPAR